MDKLPESTVARVTISTAETGLVAIESSHPLPKLKSFIDKFTTPEKRLIKLQEMMSLESIIFRCRDSIPYQRWSDLILEAILQREKNKLGATSEVNLGANTVSYMAVGDTVYEMAPVRVIPPSKAFITTRNLLLSEAHIKAEGIITQATQEARLIIDEANKNSAAIHTVAVRLKREAELALAKASVVSNRVPPIWMVELRQPFKFDDIDNQWMIDLRVEVEIKSFVYEYESRGLRQRGTWLAEPMEPLVTHMWLPIKLDGYYSITSLRMDSDSPLLPHISHDSACLSIDGLPPQIKYYYHVNAVRVAIERCITVVQLNSLYISRMTWMPTFKEIIPEELYNALTKDEWITELNHLTLQQGEDALVILEREESQTWTAIPVLQPISLDNNP